MGPARYMRRFLLRKPLFVRQMSSQNRKLRLLWGLVKAHFRELQYQQLATALATSRPTRDCGPFDEGGNNTGCGLNAGRAGFGGPKKLVMAVGLSFLASPAFSLWGLLV
jgi:hypothetical protein